MSVSCADLRNCRLEVSKRIVSPNVFHFCLDPACGSGRLHVDLAMCDNRDTINVTLQPKARDALSTIQGTRDMMEIIRKIIKSKGCVIIRVASEEDFAYLRLMRALYKESLEESWMTYVDGDEGLYSRALLAIGGSSRYYALPFKHRCSFHLTKCANIVETWGKLWVVLPPCAEFTHAGCPVTADDYVPVVAKEIEQVVVTNEEQEEQTDQVSDTAGSEEEPSAGAREKTTTTGLEGGTDKEEIGGSDTEDAVSSANEDDTRFINDEEPPQREDTEEYSEETISSDDDA